MVIGITCYPSAGGSGIVATELGQQLASRGHQVHFVSYALPFRLDRYQANVMYHGVEMTAYPLFKYPPYTLTLAAKMAEVARDHELRAVRDVLLLEERHEPTGDFAERRCGAGVAVAE